MCSTTAAASEAMKNSIGCGRPSSDMNARDCVLDREIFCEAGGTSKPAGVGGATGSLSAAVLQKKKSWVTYENRQLPC